MTAKTVLTTDTIETLRTTFNSLSGSDVGDLATLTTTATNLVGAVNEVKSNFSTNGVTLTGNQILTNKTLTAPVISSISNTGTLTLPTSSDTLVGRATSDTLTNKTFDTAGTGNVLKINGNTVSGYTGSSANAVLATGPTISTPTITGGEKHSGLSSGTTILQASATASGTLTLPAATDTLVGRATSDTLSNKTLTEPKIINNGFIADANGNKQIKFTTTSSAVNELTVINAATGNAPKISATGSDTNINLSLNAKGTGTIDAGSFRISSVADPVNNQDAATKAWVVANNSFSETRVTPTANQTTFTISYSVGYIQVFLNGIKLINGSDFTATNGTSVVLTSGAKTTDIIEFVKFK